MEGLGGEARRDSQVVKLASGGPEAGREMIEVPMRSAMDPSTKDETLGTLIPC